jgi:hypothetical protein
MKRNPMLALCAAVSALCLLAGPSVGPAAAAPGSRLPRVVPNFVPPILFKGFEPIPPDEFGLSPDFHFLVVQDTRGLRVIRLDEGHKKHDDPKDHDPKFDEDDVVFSDSFIEGHLEVGFDPSDQRLYLLEGSGGDFRFRFIDLDDGRILLDQRLPDLPEIRTNFKGSVNLLAIHELNQTRVLVFDDEGIINYRRSFSRFVHWGINSFAPSIAFVDRNGTGQTQVELVNAFSGLVILRESGLGIVDTGFEPKGPAFVVVTATSRDTFRVRMIQSETGQFLLNRTFFGAANAGFTPDGSLLGVRSRSGLSQRVYLFRTFDGRLVSSL